MHTTDFVALQMRKKATHRIVPDIFYMRGLHGQSTAELRELQRPHAASRVFSAGYLYEDVHHFAENFSIYYPNDVIPWSLVLSLR